MKYHINVAVMVLIFGIYFHTLTKTIHVVGDSHAVFCFTGKKSGNINDFSYKDHTVQFSINWLGPITMHRIGRDGLSFLNITQFNVIENDIMIFVFGEIDVRCHIGKQRDFGGRNMDEILQCLVKNYCETIIKNRSLYQTVHCVVVNVVPPSDNGFNPEFPHYGTGYSSLKA